MTSARLNKLKDIVSLYDSLLVAFSGGVDSVLLAKVAADVLGERALAVLAVSPSLPERERKEALKLAEEIGIRLETVRTKELELEAYRKNDPDRCYHCKHELFAACMKVAKAHGISIIADGFNKDDGTDYRPGHAAANKLGVRHPLQEAGMSKNDIREASRQLGLPTWNKPAMACLASRIPYGTPISTERLSQVERVERDLQDLGFGQLRARHHGEVLRIEFAAEQMNRLADASLRAKIDRLGKDAGFQYVTLDLAGYRMGSMNEGLSVEK